MYAFVDEQIGKWIREAEASGEIKNLPGYGKPLNLDDDRNIPNDYRLVSRILKNAGVLPPEVQLLKLIANYRKQLASENDKDKQNQLKVKIRDYQLKLYLALERLNPKISPRH